MKNEDNLMKKVGVFDIESNNWIEFKVLGCFDGKEYSVFYTVKQFVSHIAKRKYNGFQWYAHFGGRFDFLFLIEEFLDRGYYVRFIERSGGLIKIMVSAKNCRFVLLDSYAILPDKLSKLTTTFDVEHKKLQLDVSKGISRVTKKVLAYLKNDVLGLYEVLEKFSALDYIGGEVQSTIASQSLHTFKTMFVPFELQQLSQDDEEYIRKKFYSGGRVEVYKGYSSRCNYYDVNSLYPFAMLNEMPCGKYKFSSSFDPARIGFYEIECTIPDDLYISPLLVKVPIGAFFRNYFVNGKGLYYCSSATLLVLKQLGIRFQVKHGIVFEKREFLFNEYVEYFYKLKSEHPNDSIGLVAKYMLNALYGKLGQSRSRDVLEFWNPYLDNFSIYDDELGLVLVRKESKSKFILPYLASYITELARLHHFLLMNEKPEKMLYCDTDSLLTETKYPTSPLIGELKLVGKYEAVFLTNKVYALRNLDPNCKPKDKEKIVFKGFSSEQFSFSDFKTALFTGEFKFVQEREEMLSFRESMKRTNKITRESGRFLKTVNKRKEIRKLYDKRNIVKETKHVFDTFPKSYQQIIEESL